MGYFEHRYVYNCDVNPFYSRIMKWYRYIGYIFCIFLGGLEEAHEFVTVLITFVEELEFSLEKFIFWIWGKLITTLYTKETDHNTLLLATSSSILFEEGFTQESVLQIKKDLPFRFWFYWKVVDYEKDIFGQRISHKMG